MTRKIVSAGERATGWRVEFFAKSSAIQKSSSVFSTPGEAGDYARSAVFETDLRPARVYFERAVG